MARITITTACLLAALLTLAPAGCTRYHDYSAFVFEPKPAASENAYTVGPPDVIHISSRRISELHNHYEQIRPDGMVSLPLLGPVFAAGKTPEQLGAELQVLATQFYEDPDINVKVTSYNSKKIFVFGEVLVPGAYPYTGRNTVLDTLARSQPTRLSDPSRIHVLRPSGEGHLVRRMTVSLNDMVKDGDTSLDAVLQDGDILYVPANPLASVGLAFSQLLLPLQPAAQTVQAPVNMATGIQNTPYNGGN